MPKLCQASLIAEAVGTFLLVFTVGCNVLSNNPHWGGVSIASVLMVCVYALGGTSGANFNPAVSIALAMANKMEDKWPQALAYSGVQILAGMFGAAAYSDLFGQSFDLGPNPGWKAWQAMICEMLYTFMLCFVVLNTAASKNSEKCPNEYFGLAIGFVIIAGAYGPGAVSGGCFNPAVAIAIDLASLAKGFGWCIIYSSFELIGAGLAVGAFWLVRPEEMKGEVNKVEYRLKDKIVAEAIGTFMLVLTVGMNVLVASKAAAFSIAACLMCMIYALGDVSGAHFNPAVSISIKCASHTPFQLDELVSYVSIQIVAGIAAAFTYEAVHNGETFPLGPGKNFDWLCVGIAEVIFTGVLCFVVLSVATLNEKNPANQMVGFIIGSCVTVGGLAIGVISGGSLNPAVSLGIAAARKIIGGGSFLPGLYYVGFETIGAVLAAGVFRATHPPEIAKLEERSAKQEERNA